MEKQNTEKSLAASILGKRSAEIMKKRGRNRQFFVEMSEKAAKIRTEKRLSTAKLDT